MLATVLVCLVVGVADGDTLTARCPRQSEAHPYQEVRVRMAAIDAPEKGQPYGRKAKRALSDLVYKREVALDCYKADRYGRQVCDVWVAPTGAAAEAQKTQDAGLAMVAQGMAWWYRTYADEQEPQARRAYAEAEAQARAAGAGLWADKAPVAPWDFRHPPTGTERQLMQDETGCITGPRGGRYRLTESGRKQYGC